MRLARVLLALFVVAALGTISPVRAGNIVTNPGFESGDVSWTHQSWTISADAGVQVPHTGSWSAYTGCVGSGCLDSSTPESGAFIYQDLPTTNGQTYNLTFFYFPDDGTPNELDVYWNGSLRFSDTNDFGGRNYHQITLTGLGATGSTTRLEFFGRQDPAWLNIDDVCVDLPGGNCASVAGVPEPGTYVLASAGLLAFGIWRRRRA